MPRMPQTRNFGFATVDAAPTPRMIQGPSVAAGLGQAAGTLAGIADHAMNRDLQAKQLDVDEATRRQREQTLLDRQEAREQQAEQRRVSRLKAGNAAVELELDVGAARADLDDQLARGTIKPDEYEAKLQQFTEERAGKLRNGLDPETHLDFDQAARRPIRMAMIGAQTSLKNHRKAEAVAELDKGRENLLRVAGGDLPRALAMGEALYSREGPYAAQIGIDQAQKQGQAFREQATRSHFLRRVTDAQNDGRGLAGLRQEISANAALDPTQQATLLGSIDSRMTVLENRANAAFDRHQKKQDQAFRAIQDLDAQGLPLSAEFVSKQMAVLKGSPLAAAAAGIIQGSAQTAAFGAKPVKEQDAIIQAEGARLRSEGTDPAASKRLQKLTAIRNAHEAAIKADPWRAAQERGAIEAIPTLDLSSLAGVGESLKTRMEAAPDVDRMAGKPVSPLRQEEAEGLADTLSGLPVPERVKMLGTMQQAIGPERMRAVAEQMKAKGPIGIAAAYAAQGLKTESGANVGELVLAGAQAIKDKTVKIDEAAETGLQAQITKALDGVYASPNATQAAVEASMNVWAGASAQGRRVSPAEAVRIATGGVTEHNGQKIPMPYGWDAARVKRAVKEITPEYVQDQAGGNAPLWIGGQQILPEDVGRVMKWAKLRSAGINLYAVQIGEQLVTTDGRRPFTLKLPEVK